MRKQISPVKQKKIKKDKHQKASEVGNDNEYEPLEEQYNSHPSVLSGAGLSRSSEGNQQANQLQGRLNLSKFKLGDGWAFILQIGKYYRIVNNSNKIHIRVIDGLLNVNGKQHIQCLTIKREESLTGQACRLPHDLTSFQSELAGSMGLNKNVRQIVAKIQKKFEFSELTETQLQQLFTELADYQINESALIWTESNDVEVVELAKGEAPWHAINSVDFLSKGEVTMLLGLKNTGKSTFCQYLMNIAEKKKISICVLDLDIGRNISYPACVSLVAVDSCGRSQKISLWIGEYSPLNNIANYVKSILELFTYYKQKYFTSSLIVNTMGYLTGVGQLVFYEAFNIIKPHKVLVMRSGSQEQSAVQNVIKLLKTGSYLDRLHFKMNDTFSRTSTKIQNYTNLYAQSKPSAERFEVLISSKQMKSVSDLILLIIRKQLARLKNNIQIYRQSSSDLTQIQFCTEINTQMRLVVLGKFWRAGLFKVCGVAYGWEGKLYYDETLTDINEVDVGLISDGVDFEKGFYLVNETKLLEIEELIGKRIPHVLASFKVLGSKGVRNNPGKKTQA